jgi:hypothetical protein
MRATERLHQASSRCARGPTSRCNPRCPPAWRRRSVPPRRRMASGTRTVRLCEPAFTPRSLRFVLRTMQFPHETGQPRHPVADVGTIWPDRHPLIRSGTMRACAGRERWPLQRTQPTAPASPLLVEGVLHRIHARASCGLVGDAPLRGKDQAADPIAANAHSGQGPQRKSPDGQTQEASGLAPVGAT